MLYFVFCARGSIERQKKTAIKFRDFTVRAVIQQRIYNIPIEDNYRQWHSTRFCEHHSMSSELVKKAQVTERISVTVI